MVIYKIAENPSLRALQNFRICLIPWSHAYYYGYIDSRLRFQVSHLGLMILINARIYLKFRWKKFCYAKLIQLLNNYGYIVISSLVLSESAINNIRVLTGVLAAGLLLVMHEQRQEEMEAGVSKIFRAAENGSS